MAQALPYILVAASTVVSIKGQKDAANAAQTEARVESRREGDAARSREIQRRRALLRSLASQNASAGAAGVAPNSTVANADIQYAVDDLMTDRGNTSSVQAQLALQAKNAGRASRIGIASSLLDGASKTYDLTGSSKPKPKKP